MLKKIAFLLLMSTAVICFPYQALAEAKPFLITLSIGTDTAPSGTSIFTIYTRSDKLVGTDKLKNLEDTDANFIFQLSATSPYAGVSHSGASVMSNGSNWYSGASITVRYMESLINTTDAFLSATRVNILDGVALSGETEIQIPFYPQAMGYLGFELLSGISGFSGITGYVQIK